MDGSTQETGNHLGVALGNGPQQRAVGTVVHPVHAAVGSFAWVDLGDAGHGNDQRRQHAEKDRGEPGSPWGSAVTHSHLQSRCPE